MKTLYRLTAHTTPAAAAAMEGLLADSALATSLMQAPRTKTAIVEAIFAEPPARKDWIMRLSVMAALHSAKAPSIKIEKIPLTGWLEKVAQEHPPIHAERLVIYGSHASNAVKPPQKSLLIEAATAFGTGEHMTTLGCLLALQKILHKKKPRHALDLGCGSGILALGLARLTRGKCLAVDNDAESVRMARHNARVNQLQHFVRIERSHGYAAAVVRAGKPYDLIMANIFARPLMLLAKDLKAHLAPGGIAILSGLLQEQENMVLSAHRLQGLRLLWRWRRNDWSVLVLQK
jgi:ribosomal protein L11 methyltransferase